MLLHGGEPRVVLPGARGDVTGASWCKCTAPAAAVSLPFLLLAANVQQQHYEEDTALRWSSVLRWFVRLRAVQKLESEFSLQTRPASHSLLRLAGAGTGNTWATCLLPRFYARAW